MKIEEISDSLDRAAAHTIAIHTLPPGSKRSADETYHLDVQTVLDKAKRMSAEELGVTPEAKTAIDDRIATLKRKLVEQLNP